MSNEDKYQCIDADGDVTGPYMRVAPVFRFAIRDDLSASYNGIAASSFLPTRGTDRATGWDVRAAMPEGKELVVRPGSYVKIPLGFRVLAPDGWWLDLRPRSSSFTKKQLHALYGVIDEDYEGQCIFACQYMPDLRSLGNDLVIKFGEAIGQIIPVRRQEMIVMEINNTEYADGCQLRNAQRGAGGFGSTGR